LLAALSLTAGIAGGFMTFSFLAGLFPFGPKNAENLPPVRIIEKQETIIQENTALKNAITKVNNTAIGVKITSPKSAVASGSGVILTSDGMAAIPYSLFSPNSVAKITAGGKAVTFEVLKRDKTANLVIAKLADGNWPTAGFYRLENLKLGERVFLIGILPSGQSFINEGIVRDFTSDVITTSIYEKTEAVGAPVFDVEGNILGIAQVAKNGQVSAIPISKIKEISGL